MFCDEVTISVKAGSGGSGCVSFHREKYVAKGPPDGGDGGRGGNIIFKVNENKNTLHYFLTHRAFDAPRGTDGSKRNRTGACGEDLILEVPQGTQVKDAETGEILADLWQKEDEYFAAKGGKGGLGNARFVSSVHQAPDIAERGEPGQERDLKLELKLVADCAIVGMPNAGKSTLISVISNARPKVADYEFTTLVPNLGVVEVGDETLVLCDVPGLIEGAHEGKGLGDKFLKHIQRCKVLIHLIDGTDMEIADTYKKIRNELESYSSELCEKKEIVVLSKADSFDEEWRDHQIAELKKEGVSKVFTISSVAHKGTKEMLFEVLKEVHNENKRREEAGVEVEEVAVYQPHLEGHKMSQFEITKSQGGDFTVKGQRLEQLVVMTNFEQRDSRIRVYNILKKIGLIKALRKAGAQPDSHFWIGNKRFSCEEWSM